MGLLDGPNLYDFTRTSIFTPNGGFQECQKDAANLVATRQDDHDKDTDKIL